MSFQRSRLMFDPSAAASAGRRGSPFSQPDLVCLSHLRWDFVFQRPQHLMTRAARDRRVFFVEEPVAASEPLLHVRRDTSGVWIVVPGLPADPGRSRRDHLTSGLLREFLIAMQSDSHVAWYLTPMAHASARDLAPLATVYDCMDELSAFAHAPAGLADAEARLLEAADLVFTGGWSLYEAKRNRHRHVHPFPSSVDYAHFVQARGPIAEAVDQLPIPYPRLGYFGVIDERLDLDLIAGLADARPCFQIVLVGPVTKIDPASVPQRPNVHLLGSKPYASLPSYIAGWDVALLPFALNEATRFISPTKTPEYLAAGRAVVSTPVRDVVCPYGEADLVTIADGVCEFVQAVDTALIEPAADRVARADLFLASQSWDDTWQRMSALIDDVVTARRVNERQHVAHAPASVSEELPVTPRRCVAAARAASSRVGQA